MENRRRCARLHALLALFLLLAACGLGDEEPEPWPPEVRYEFFEPDEPGPYAVGRRDAQLVIPSNGRRVPTRIRYPADAAAGPALCRDPFPVVVFSHGNRMNPDLYAPLLEHLASHGYVVAAPWHPGSNTLDSFPRPDPLAAAGSALERPVEVSFALDELLRMNQDPHSPLFGLVDGTRAGICGQSFGGYTTLLVAGAEVDANFEFTMAGGALGEAGGDTVSAADYCESIGWEEGSPTCALLRDALAGSGRMSLPDDRFRAAVAITPPLHAAFGEEGIAEVSRPVLIIAGELDEQVDYESNILPMYRALRVPRALVNMRRAGHNGNNSVCGFLFLLFGFDQTPPEYCDKSQAYTRTFTTAFFGLHLKGLARNRAYLNADYANTLDSVEWRAESSFPSSSGDGDLLEVRDDGVHLPLGRLD